MFFNIIFLRNRTSECKKNQKYFLIFVEKSGAFLTEQKKTFIA